MSDGRDDSNAKTVADYMIFRKFRVFQLLAEIVLEIFDDLAKKVISGTLPAKKKADLR